MTEIPLTEPALWEAFKVLAAGLGGIWLIRWFNRLVGTGDGKTDIR